jgi:hypothetical protein
LDKGNAARPHIPRSRHPHLPRKSPADGAAIATSHTSCRRFLTSLCIQEDARDVTVRYYCATSLRTSASAIRMGTLPPSASEGFACQHPLAIEGGGGRRRAGARLGFLPPELVLVFLFAGSRFGLVLGKEQLFVNGGSVTTRSGQDAPLSLECDIYIESSQLCI